MSSDAEDSWDAVFSTVTRVDVSEEQLRQFSDEEDFNEISVKLGVEFAS